MPRKSTDSQMMKAAKKIAKLLVDSGLPVVEQKGAMSIASTMLFYKLQEPKVVDKMGVSMSLSAEQIDAFGRGK